MKPPFKSSPVERDQRLMFPSNVFDLLDDEHECYLYQDIFKQLDTAELEGHYSVRGQRAYPPQLIVSILIYAYSRVSSVPEKSKGAAVKISRLCISPR
jgi:transposase